MAVMEPPRHLQFAHVAMHLVDLVHFWPDAGSPWRRWKCRLCRKHRPPREPSIDAIFRAAAEHVTSVHRVVVMTEPSAELVKAGW